MYHKSHHFDRLTKLIETGEVVYGGEIILKIERLK